MHACKSHALSMHSRIMLSTAHALSVSLPFHAVNWITNTQSRFHHVTTLQSLPSCIKLISRCTHENHSPGSLRDNVLQAAVTSTAFPRPARKGEDGEDFTLQSRVGDWMFFWGPLQDHEGWSGYHLIKPYGMLGMNQGHRHQKVWILSILNLISLPTYPFSLTSHFSWAPNNS